MVHDRWGPGAINPMTRWMVPANGVTVEDPQDLAWSRLGTDGMRQHGRKLGGLIDSDPQHAVVAQRCLDAGARQGI